MIERNQPETVDPPVTLQPPSRQRLGEVVASFGKLGLLSFGGPVAHLAYFRTEFVERRKWIGDADYADLVALCQFLPGPASSQVVFALGMQRAGLVGGLIASICFTMPSALLLIAFAYGVSSMGDLSEAGWLHGLKLAAVAVVAQAVWGMGRNLCPDRERITICVLVAVLLLAWPGAMLQVGLIAGGALVGYLLYRREDSVVIGEHAVSPPVKGHRWAIAALAVFFVLLVVLPLAVPPWGRGPIAYFDSFYRSGSLVFGGGHVVLPMLRAEVVPRGWLTDDQFLAGYAAAQAVPGPLFTFSAYLGAAMEPGRAAWVNGLWCLLAIFLPAWLLIAGALPFWHSLRSRRWAQSALRGANAAVVGILLAALYQPVIVDGVHGPRDVAAAVAAFTALHHWKQPAWLVVLVLGVAGETVLR